MEIKITSIKSYGNHIDIILNNSSYATFYKLGNLGDIYTVTSDNISKHSLLEFKKSIKLCEWDINKLKKIWLIEK